MPVNCQAAVDNGAVAPFVTGQDDAHDHEGTLVADDEDGPARILDGSAFSILGVAGLVVGVSGAASRLTVLVAVGFLAIGAAHLASAVALRRQRRSSLPAAAADGGLPSSG